MGLKKLELIPTLTQAGRLCITNVFPLLLTVVLYMLTCWIPYLNVGTTVGLMRVIINLPKGEPLDPLAIFSKENFTGMGNFFLLLGFLTIGIAAASLFMLVPAIVMGIAWNYALYLLIEKKVSPLKALSLSDKVCYGEKWNIFLIYAVLTLAVVIIIGLFGSIPKVGGIFAAILAILACTLFVTTEAVMYSHFSEKADSLLAEGRGAYPGNDSPVEVPAEGTAA